MTKNFTRVRKEQEKKKKKRRQRVQKMNRGWYSAIVLKCISDSLV